MSKIDLLGLKFGTLTPIEFRHFTKAGAAKWWCRCDCGVEKLVDSYGMRIGRIASCGCQKRIKFTARVTKHGMYQSKTYKAWNGMMMRCTNKNTQFYKDYGGRGITVCERWKNFMNFRDDMGLAPEGLSLDRVDNDKGYSPENCRWTTRTIQMRNRRISLLVTCDGETKSLGEWAREKGFNFITLRSRYFMSPTKDPEFIFRPVATKFRPRPRPQNQS